MLHPLHLWDLTPTQLLAEMQERGEGIELTWGEDTGCWECSWILGGVRHTGVARGFEEALIACYAQALNASAARAS